MASLTTPISRRIPLDTGLGYHVLEWGRAEAPIVILLHGFLDFAWTWEAMVESGLLSNYRLIAPDLRGFGDSDRIGPGGYYHFLDYLSDVHALVENVRDGRKVSIVGHSMGGSIAAYYAGSYPDLVEKLVVLEGLGPPAQPVASMPERIRTWLAAWQRVRRYAARPMASLDEAAERLRRHDPRLDPELALRLAAHGTREVEGGKRLFKHDPLHLTPGPYPFTLELASAFWRGIACPTLLVDAQASEFQYAPEDLAQRIACFKHARCETLADCGHMMQRHQPVALAQLIAAFLKTQ